MNFFAVIKFQQHRFRLLVTLCTFRTFGAQLSVFVLLFIYLFLFILYIYIYWGKSLQSLGSGRVERVGRFTVNATVFSPE